MKTVVFDLDGTIADTSADLISAANFCFASLGYPKLLDNEKDAGVAMQGGRAMLELGCQKIGLNDERFIHQQYPILLNAYSKCLDKHTEFFPYALDAIRKLKLLGINSAICTNKPSALAEELMVRLGARHLFRELIGSDTLSSKKEEERFRLLIHSVFKSFTRFEAWYVRSFNLNLSSCLRIAASTSSAVLNRESSKTY